jgi:AhpD family alkylhydroperoxidase
MDNARLRHFHSIGDVFRGFGSVFTGVRLLKKQRGSAGISPSFAEKIMLAVTGVNECAYCSFLHTQTALEKGVTESEIGNMLVGVYDGCSIEETTALLFAQHWAETMGAVSAEAKKRFVDACGAETADGVEGYIRIVFLGNICSNTVVFYEDKTISPAEKKGMLFAYLLCKPIAASIRKRGTKLAALHADAPLK